MGEIKIPGPQFGLNELIDVYTDVSDQWKFNPIRPSSAGKGERELGYELMEFRGYATYEKRKQQEPATQTSFGFRR